MAEWFRNSEWNPEIERTFEEKLGRARDKAQYLRIQGSMLKDAEPEVALGLLGRCIELGEDTYIAAAQLDSAHAHHRLGDVDAALTSLEAALDQESRQPMFRTSAAFDYAMLVALHERSERFERALAALDQLGIALLPVMEFQNHSARAIILFAQGHREEARAAAERAAAVEGAQGWIPGHPEVGMAPGAANPLSAKVREVLESTG